jgi:hypothetical protein
MQMPLDPVMEAERVEQRARQMYERSRYLCARYASFSQLMDDPVAGRCLRLCALHSLRLGDRARGQ